MNASAHNCGLLLMQLVKSESVSSLQVSATALNSSFSLE